MKVNNVILTGFDRSGTSAISKTIAQHPQVELVFRPFNGGSIRRKMYQILSDQNASQSDFEFFEGLQKGKFLSAYVESWWHQKYSTIKDAFADNKLHLLITNLNHFTIPWLKERFPLLENWAIWREPLDVLQSCIENDFLGNWYLDALTEVRVAVDATECLRRHFRTYSNRLDDDVKTTAYLIAVRNTYLFENIEHGKLIDYELFKKDPNTALLPFLQYFGLDEDFDFTPMLTRDLNSIPGRVQYVPGKPKVYNFSLEQREFVDELFAPLRAAFLRKNL